MKNICIVFSSFLLFSTFLSYCGSRPAYFEHNPNVAIAVGQIPAYAPENVALPIPQQRVDDRMQQSCASRCFSSTRRHGYKVLAAASVALEVALLFFYFHRPLAVTFTS